MTETEKRAKLDKLMVDRVDLAKSASVRLADLAIKWSALRRVDRRRTDALVEILTDKGLFLKYLKGVAQNRNTGQAEFIRQLASLGLANVHLIHTDAKLEAEKEAQAIVEGN